MNISSYPGGGKWSLSGPERVILAGSNGPNGSNRAFGMTPKI